MFTKLKTEATRNNKNPQIRSFIGMCILKGSETSSCEHLYAVLRKITTKTRVKNSLRFLSFCFDFFSSFYCDVFSYNPRWKQEGQLIRFCWKNILGNLNKKGKL